MTRSLRLATLFVALLALSGATVGPSPARELRVCVTAAWCRTHERDARAPRRQLRPRSLLLTAVARCLRHGIAAVVSVPRLRLTHAAFRRPPPSLLFA